MTQAILNINGTEYLCVERKKVQEYYSETAKSIKEISDCNIKEQCRGEIAALKALFGDKCLPDIEEQNSPKLSNSCQIGKDVKPEPKFKVGDIVIAKTWIGEQFPQKIVMIEYDVAYFEKGNPAPIEDLEPYTEETKANFVRLADEPESIVKGVQSAETAIQPMEETKYGENSVFPKPSIEYKLPEPIEELNLCELLKGCEGERFYSPLYGDVSIELNSNTNYPITILSKYGNTRILESNGKFGRKEGECLLYPSRALYEKYPLDAYSAWMEWKDARKPKKWTPQIGEHIFWVNANLTVSQDRFNNFETQRKRRAVGNEFKTGKEAQQAAEALRKALQDFHEKNSNK